jgi:hypothetical protein
MRRYLSVFGVLLRRTLAVAVPLGVAATAVGAGERVVVSMDGTWEIAEGSLSQPPTEYTHTVLVPGLWERACGQAYAIEISQDGGKWQEVWRTNNGRGGVEEIRFAPAAARYLRFRGDRRASPHGFSLWELQVFER